jgi:hypothetical protein
MLGSTCNHLGLYDKGVEQHLAADLLARTRGPDDPLTLPPGHPNTENYRNGVGQCLTAQGKCREAIDYLEVAQARQVKNQGLHDFYTRDATKGLAEAYEACGRKADAERSRRLIDPTAGSGP